MHIKKNEWKLVYLDDLLDDIFFNYCITMNMDIYFVKKCPTVILLLKIISYREEYALKILELIITLLQNPDLYLYSSVYFDIVNNIFMGRNSEKLLSKKKVRESLYNVISDNMVRFTMHINIQYYIINICKNISQKSKRTRNNWKEILPHLKTSMMIYNFHWGFHNECILFLDSLIANREDITTQEIKNQKRIKKDILKYDIHMIIKQTMERFYHVEVLQENISQLFYHFTMNHRDINDKILKARIGSNVFYNMYRNIENANIQANCLGVLYNIVKNSTIWRRKLLKSRSIMLHVKKTLEIHNNNPYIVSIGNEIMSNSPIKER